ncbi:type II toxin -antitoxin system TacA 1-like antitoxin [Kosakonia sacchari]
MLNEDSWYRVINAIENPPNPNEKLKQAAKRLSNIKS